MYFLSSAVEEDADEARQDFMKSCRRGFMRCRSLEGPWGSHHDEARREKCETSDWETEEVGVIGESAALVECGLLCCVYIFLLRPASSCVCNTLGRCACSVAGCRKAVTCSFR